MDTKQKILDTALDMFSKRGFSAVSVRDISYAIGVKESAMYKHFTNKQAVFDTLVENYMKKSDSFMSGIGSIYNGDLEELSKQAGRYEDMSGEEFLQIGSSVFTDFLIKPEVMKFWRMISIEQYNNPKMAEIFNSLLFEQPIQFQTVFFQVLVSYGVLKDIDPSTLALEFYTPLLMLYLRILPFEAENSIVSESLLLFRKHMSHFQAVYAHPSLHFKGLD